MRVWKLEGVTMVDMVVKVVCLQHLILKVSGRYLKFWLSYKGSLNKWLTCKRESRVELSDYNGCLACSWGRARGSSRARAAQYLVAILGNLVSCLGGTSIILREALLEDLTLHNIKHIVKCSHFRGRNIIIV